MTLVVVGIVVIFITAMISTNKNLFGFSKRSQDQAAALALGRGGLNRLIQRLTYQDSFSGDLTYGDTTTGYDITFDPSDPDRSVNNLFNDAASSDTNSQGMVVPPHTADIVVIARSGGVTRKLRFVLKRGLAFQGAMAANGRLLFGKDVDLKSITSIRDDDPVEARFHANDSLEVGTGVVWDNSGVFNIGDGCEVSSATAVEASIVSSNPSRVSQDVPEIAIPSLNIDRMVSDSSGAPAPTSLPGGGLYCDSNSYIGTSTTVNSDINLYDASLYVNGDLIINGGVIGYGSIYATGDVTIRGGNASVITNQPSGAAILAGGDITFDALSASGYIDTLTGDAAVNAAWTRFKDAYRVLSEVTDPSNSGPGYTKPTDYDAVFPPPTLPVYVDISSCSIPGSPLLRADNFHWAGFNLGKGDVTMTPSPPETDMPIPSPAPGLTPPWTENSYSRSLKEAIASVAGSDPRAVQVNRALDHVAFYFRHGFYNPPPIWDDEGLPIDDGFSWSIDHQLWAVHNIHPLGGVPPVGYYPVTFTQEQMAQGVEEYFAYHDPLNFGWLGRSYFQGLLYAKGDITISNRAEVIGTVIAGGNLSVLDGASFTYNREYDELTQNLSGPVRVTSFQEL